MNQHQIKNYTYKRGFTLVELIIVITILAILSVIAFVSFQSYSGNARDGNRVTTLKNIQNGLELFMTKVGNYPTPEGNISEGTIQGNTYITKGEIGETIIKQIQMNTLPIDPETKHSYIYALTSGNNEYQLATITESLNTYKPFISQTYAKSYQAKVEGNYRGFLKYQSGSISEGCISYVNLPSLIWNNTGTVDLLEVEDITTSPNYIVNNGQNLPYSPGSEIGNIKTNQIIQFVRNNQNAKLVHLCEEKIKEIAEKTGEMNQEEKEIFIDFGIETQEKLKNKLLGENNQINKNNPLNDKSCGIISHNQTKTFWKTSSVAYGETCETGIVFRCNNGEWQNENFNKTEYSSEVECIVGTPLICNSTEINGYQLSEKSHGENQESMKNDETFVNGKKQFSQNFVCNNGIFEISGEESSQITECGIDYYSNNGVCENVGVGYFSENTLLNRTVCTNKPQNSIYNSSGNGENKCSYTCNDGYEGLSCSPKQKIITTAEYSGRIFTFSSFVLSYGTPQTKVSNPLNIYGGISTLTATFTLGTNGETVTLSQQGEAISCLSNHVQVGNECKRNIISLEGGGRVWSDQTYAKSCNGYRNPTGNYTYAGAIGDGIYSIKPDTNPAFQVFCDMTSDGGGWTVITNSFANNAGDTTKPFDVDWNTITTQGVGNITNMSNNFYISINKYLSLANVNNKVQYAWYAKSGKPSDPWQKTIEYSNHYLENDSFYTSIGDRIFGTNAFSGGGGYKLTTKDRDNDTHSSNCAQYYGAFGWYTECHDAQFWSMTDDRTLACSPDNPYLLVTGERDYGGRAVCNGYSNSGPDAGGAYNTWYQLKIMIR